MAREYGMGRTERATTMVSREEKAQLAENAAWFGMTVPEFLRYAGLGGTFERPTLRERQARRARRAVA